MSDIAFDIAIPDSLITKIQVADKRLKTLANTSEQTKNRVNAAFRKMALGVDDFIKKLKEADEQFGKLGSKNIVINIKGVGTEVKKNVTDINKLIEAIGKLNESQKKQIDKAASQQLYRQTLNDIRALRVEEEERARSLREQIRQSKADEKLRAEEIKTQMMQNIVNEKQRQIEIRRSLEEINRLARAYKQMPTAFNSKQTGKIISDNENAKSINQMITAIRNLENAKRDLDTTDKKYEKTLAKLNSEIVRYKRELERLTTIKPQTLIDQKGQHKTLNELKTYSNELKRTMATLDPKSKEWGKLNKIFKQTNTQIQNINNKMKGFQDATSRTRGIVDQLRRSLLLMFSLSQIKGYVDKLIAVRGEFELQQRSLEAILQNKEKADEIWAKTIELAVKSPFQIKELVTYTKQLAAYRVEANKLFDTTKMLADVSAGLGVDMQRIILAYGQVKAANYLRGTELRQFSEAGINILGELATYFSEIEDRAVSVGEVFQRVSKRMVSFADVEEIFKRITSEGGTFYNMQEIQAETLKGMISNLKDSWEIAVNDIGESNEDVLKGSIRMVRKLVENWEEYKNIILGIGSGVALKGLLAIVRSIGLAVMGIINGLRVMSFGGITSAISVILGIVVAIASNVSKAKREAKELSKIELTGVSQASMMAAEYEKLANIVADTSKTFDEQQKALNTLKRKYDEILPSHLLEADAIRTLNGDYKDATQAINEYIAAKTKEKQIQYIEEEYGGRVTQTGEDLVSRLYNNIKKSAPAVKRSDLTIIVGQLQKEVEQGLIESGKEGERLSEMLMQALGLKINEEVWQHYVESFNELTGVTKRELNVDFLDNFISAITRKNQKIEEITNQSLWEDMVYRDMNAIKEGYEKMKGSIGTYYDTIRKYLKGDELVTEKQYNEAISTLNSFFENVGQEAPQWNEIINDPIRLRKATVDANKALWEDMMAEIIVSTQDASQVTRNAFLEILDKEQIAFAGNKLQQEVIRVLTYLSDTMGIPLTSGIGQLLASDTESKDEYAKRLVELIDSYKAAIAQYELDLKKNAGFSIFDPDQIEEMKRSLPLLEQYKTYFFIDNKKDKSQNIFEERLRILKEMYDAYKNLNKTFDETKSIEGVDDKYRQAFKDAFGFDFDVWGNFFTNEDDYREALQKLKVMTKDAKDQLKVEIEKGRIIWDMEVKLKTDQDKDLKDELQSYFDQYESMLELNKLGISGDAAYSLFGVESMDLDKLRSVVDQFKDQFIGTDMEDEYKKFQDKLTEMEVKAQQERLKKYLQYTRDAISERAKLELQGAKNLAEIEKTWAQAKKDIEEKYAISDKDSADEIARKTEEKTNALLALESSKPQAIEGVRKEMQGALQELDWKEFSSSDTFVSIFNDLENTSTQALTSMIDQLEKYKSEWTDLPIDQMEAIAKQLEKMKNARDVNEAVANPFKSGAFADGRLKAEDISKAQQNMISADESILASNKQISNAEYLLQLLNEEKNLKDQSVVKGLELAKLGIDYTQSTEKQKEILEKVIKDEQKNVNTQKQNKKNAQGTLDLAKKQKAVLEAQSKYLGEGLQMANDLYGAFSGLYEALGGDKDNPVAIFADMGMNMANTVIQTIQLQIQLNIAAQSATGLGVAMNTAMGVIGWIVMAIQLLTAAISAITKAHDNALQKQIERDAEAVELLQKRYEKLEEAIDNAMSFGEYQQAFDENKRNLEEQIRLTEDMIALEEDKKKTDEDAIKGYKDNIEEYNEQLQEMEEKRISDMGGFGSQEAIKDAAIDFVDAWAEAYNETGDGLDALRGKWDEYFDNLLKKQMMMKVADKYLKSALTEIDKALEDDVLTGEEMENLERVKEESSTKLNNIMKQLAEQMGWEGGTGGGSELDGLSESIQGVTEVTAQALEAILNSMRFYVIDNNKQLIDIANTLLSWESPTSPILAELKAQTNYLSSIESLFNSVVDRNGSPAVRIR